MKKIGVVLVSLVVAVLIGVGNVFAQNETSNIPNPPLNPADWEWVFTNFSGGTFYVDKIGILRYLPGKYLVPTLYVPRGEDRREDINALKRDLFLRGEDPNEAERLWYAIELIKLNCKTNQYALLKITDYSFGQTVLINESPPYVEWHYIIPGWPIKAVENYVCEQHE